MGRRTYRGGPMAVTSSSGLHQTATDRLSGRPSRVRGLRLECPPSPGALPHPPCAPVAPCSFLTPGYSSEHLHRCSLEALVSLSSKVFGSPPNKRFVLADPADSRRPTALRATLLLNQVKSYPTPMRIIHFPSLASHTHVYLLSFMRMPIR